MGAATLIEAGGEKFLFDAGRGVLQRLGESRLDIPAVDEVFFTHLHSDHLEGLPALWMTSWFITKRNTPMTFRGPPGTRAALDGLRAFMGHDLRARVNAVVQATGVEMIVEETEGGLVLDRDGVRIRAIPARHGDGDPSLAYLFEYGGRSVLLTGDSTWTPRFGEAVANADVTVCNVYAPSLELLARLDEQPAPIPTVVRAVAAKLASPEQAAAMFRETGARLGVYTHNIFYDSSEAQVLERTRRAGFDGEVLIAGDRMYVDVGERISIHAAPRVPADLEINSLNFRAVLQP
ncbi:MAG TPA: MBL fold metallo-hydrolase [Pseudomonadales bacterium]|nr:MBL fold metallo-hydrolase [Pseudomonadales bacterium]